VRKRPALKERGSSARKPAPFASVREPESAGTRWYALGLVLLAVCLVYANSFGNAFHFDDLHTVSDNPAIRSLANLPRIFTDATAFSVVPANQSYRPLVTASLAFDYALGRGYNLFWFHLSTLVWFLVLLALLYFLLERLLDLMEPGRVNRWLALGICGWFGLHPAMAETVNYIVQRGDLYCTLGSVAALLVFVQWPRRRRTGLYLLPFLLAMLSKPTAAVFPLLLLLYVFFFEAQGKQRWRTALLACLPALVLTGFLLAAEAAMTPRTFTSSTIPAADYLRTQPFVWLRYAGTLLVPLHLNVDTDLDPLTEWNAPAVAGFLFVLGLLALVGYIAVRRRRKLYPIAFGVSWFIVTQLPTSLYTLDEVENDHRMFFSFPGLMLAGVWTLYLVYQRLGGLAGRRVPLPGWQRRVAVGLAAGGLCGYAYGAHRRNEVWHTEESLWADDVRKSPHNGRGLMIYGVIRMDAGDLAGALTLFERARLYTPNYATLEENLGIVNSLLAARGDASRSTPAEAHFRRAIAFAPREDTAHAYYGRWLLTQGRLEEAAAQIQTAVALNSQRPMNRDLLLQAYSQQGNTGAAKQLAEETLRMDPTDGAALRTLNGDVDRETSEADGHINASLAAYREGRFQETVAEARKALVIDPRSAAAWNNIGAAYGALRQWDAAIDAEQHAIQIDPGLQVAQNNLRSFVAQRSRSMAAPRDDAAGRGSVKHAVIPE